MILRLATFTLFALLAAPIGAQPNCQAYLYYGDTLKYEACLICEEAAGLHQFSRAFQEVFDRAIAHCPDYDHAYRSKSVAYLKSGDFIRWKQLMDRAVELNPVDHLGYRGWSHFQFFRDYRSAIADLEQLDSLLNYDIGYSQNGYYHLQFARALSYKALGKLEKAMQIMQGQLARDNYSVSLFDYLHLGVVQLELGQLAAAEKTLLLQNQVNPLADTEYYLAQIDLQQQQSEQAILHLKKALAHYQKKRHLQDPYTHQIDKVYLVQIQRALKQLESGE